MSKRKSEVVIASDNEDDQSEENSQEGENGKTIVFSDSDSDHKKKNNLSKLKQLKPKTKTLDFNTFLKRIESLQIDLTCLNYLRDEDQLPNPSRKYLLNSCKLKNHQWEAVSWLKSLLLDNDTSGILGDDMGLGKTLEVISFFCYWMEIIDEQEEIDKKPFLIVSPLSLIENWCLEFKKFCGDSVSVLRYHGNKQERAELQETLKEETVELGEFPYDVIVTSYETVTNDESFLSSLEYVCLCVDEAHRLKNPNSILYKALQQIYKYERVILMSGTPLMNNTKELWSLLYFCAPTYFDHLFETFDSWFPQQCFLSKSTLKKSVSESVEMEDYDESVESVDADNVRSNFQTVLKPFLLRRTKNQVLKNDLPLKEEHIIYTRLTTMQKKFYKGFLMGDRNAIGKKNSRGLNNILMSLRKCCDHPYMFDGAEPEPFHEGEHIVNNSGKMIILDKLLKKLKQDGHKVLIFSQMTQMLDILQDYMHFRKWNYERLDGSVRGEERFEAIKSFTDKDVFVFLLSTRAGGVGLNLTSADTVIFMDMDMNPQMDLQAQARCHRIGQDKPVTVYRLVVESSVEEVILKRSMKKIALSINTIDTSSAVSNAFDSASDDKLSSETIMEMISFGLHKIMDSTTDESEESDEKLLDLTIDELLAKKGPKRLSLSLESAAESLQDVESGSIYMYDGVDYRQKPTIPSKDVEALQQLLGEAGIELCSQKTEHHTTKKKKKAPPKKPKKTKECVDESLVFSSEDELVDEDEDDGYISPISTRTRSSKRSVSQAKRRKIQSSDDEESEYDEYDPHLIEIPDDWELEVYLLEKEFNREDDDPLSPITVDSNTIHYVKGDVTQPEKYEHSGNRFIVNVISDFGQFPSAGISKHITGKYGKKVKSIYENACEQEQISVGDAQLIPVKSKKGVTYIVNVIAQHYEKSKGHGPIINSALEIALDKVCYSAVTMGATVHMPRIGFGIKGFDWYSTERIIKKCLLKAKVKTYVYYFDRTGSYSNWNNQQQKTSSTPTKSFNTPNKTPETTPTTSNNTPNKTTLSNTPKNTPVSTPTQQADDPLEGMKIYLFGAENKNNKKLKGSITLNGGVLSNEMKCLDMIVVNSENQFAEVDMDETEDQETIIARKYIKENPQCMVVTAQSILEMVGN